MSALPKINLKAEIPEELKTDASTTKWGKVLSVTPVVMTVIATMLAGLSSSEMTRAQYDRSLAAQRQAKAGDQWNFFQSKRLRAVLLRSTLDLMRQNATEGRPLDLAALRSGLAGTSAAAELNTPAGQQTFSVLSTGALPALPPSLEFAANVKAALAALDESRPDAEVAALLNKIDGAALDGALRQGHEQALAFDALLKPIGQTIDNWEK